MDFLAKFVDDCPCVKKTLLVVGALTVFKYAFALAHSFVRFALFGNKNLLKRYGPGSWAVVTGCTEGIGQAYAIEFGRRGFNVVLVARNREKLERVAQKVTAANPNVKTQIIVADFLKSYESDFYDRIDAQLRGVDVSVLVNNIGLGHGGHFERLSDAQCREMVYLNVFPIVFMSRIVVPRMLQRAPRYRSAVLNLSSQAGKCTSPYLSVYAATKSFDLAFSNALNYEYRDKIDVLSVNPGAVLTTRTSSMELPLVATTESVVNWSLRHLGTCNETAGDPRHAGISALMGFLPTPLAEFTFAKANLDIWSKYYKQQAGNDGNAGTGKKNE